MLESLPEQFAQGDKVRVLAKPDYWVAGGTLSFTAKDMRHEGLGDILEKIEQLRATLRDVMSRTNALVVGLKYSF